MTEIKEILNPILIPDLVSIINDYILTPFEYYKLIDNKRYSPQEYEEYQREYEITIAKEISRNYKFEYEIISDLIDTEFKNDLYSAISILITNKKVDIDLYNSETKNKYQQCHQKLLDKYIKILIQEFKNSNIFITETFLKTLWDRYLITGTDIIDGKMKMEYPINNRINARFGIQYMDKPTNKMFVTEHMSILWEIYAEVINGNLALESKIKDQLYKVLL